MYLSSLWKFLLQRCELVCTVNLVLIFPEETRTIVMCTSVPCNTDVDTPGLDSYCNDVYYYFYRNSCYSDEYHVVLLIFFWRFIREHRAIMMYTSMSCDTDIDVPF